MPNSNKETDIGIELADLCIAGKGTDASEAFREAIMNSVVSTRLVGANSSRANAGFHVSQGDESHVFLSLKCGFKYNAELPQRKGKQLAVKPCILALTNVLLYPAKLLLTNSYTCGEMLSISNISCNAAFIMAWRSGV